MKRVAVAFIAAAYCCAAVGCQKHSGSKDANSEPPAKVMQTSNEQKLATITLTPQAEARLGIRLAQVQLANVQRKRTLGGEVVLRPDQAISIAAPIAGTISAPDENEIPAAGSRVAKDQPLFVLKPLLTPERDVLTPAERVGVAQTTASLDAMQLDAEREIESAKLRVDATHINYDRAAKLLADEAGSQRTVDEMMTQLKLAEEALKTARERHELLAKISLDADAGDLGLQSMTAPLAGILRTIDAAPGETVTMGSKLFEVVNVDRMWIRVPVFVGQWRELDLTQVALVKEFGQPASVPARAARPVAAPPAADPLSSSVDLYYEIDNADGRLYPGQKLEVTLTMRSPETSLVVPWAAILFDIHGGEWVFEQTSPQKYIRRRVQVRYVDRDLAVLEVGPLPGTKIVTDGAAELFGTEFGIGK